MSTNMTAHGALYDYAMACDRHNEPVHPTWLRHGQWQTNEPVHPVTTPWPITGTKTQFTLCDYAMANDKHNEPVHLVWLGHDQWQARRTSLFIKKKCLKESWLSTLWKKIKTHKRLESSFLNETTQNDLQKFDKTSLSSKQIYKYNIYINNEEI